MALQALERRLPPIGITFIDISPAAAGARRRRHSHGGFTPHTYKPIANSFFLDEEEEQAHEDSATNKDATLSTLASSTSNTLEASTLNNSVAEPSEGGTLTSSLGDPSEGCKEGSLDNDNDNDSYNKEPPIYFSEGGMQHYFRGRQERPASLSEGSFMHSVDEDPREGEKHQDFGAPKYLSEEHRDYYNEESPPANYSYDCEEPQYDPADSPPAFYSEGCPSYHLSEGEPRFCSEGNPQSAYRNTEEQPLSRSVSKLSWQSHTSEPRGQWTGNQRRLSKQNGAHRGAGHNLPIGAPPPQQPIGGRWSDLPPVGSPPGTGSLRRNSNTEVNVGNFGPEVTTVMIRNLPGNIKQQDLLDELDRSNFKGLYDFVYMPCSFKTGEGKGFAFVNFVCAEAVTSFANSWHRSRRLGMAAREPQLNISPAEVQGLQENLARWSVPRMRRIRNPNLRPYTTQDQSTSSQDAHRGATRTEEEAPSAQIPMQARQLLAAAVAQGRTPPPSLEAAVPRGLLLQRCEQLGTDDLSMLDGKGALAG